MHMLPMVISALYLIGKDRISLDISITDTWLIKLSDTYTMKFYSSIKKIERTETIKLAGKWMKPENLTLSEVTQAQQDKYYVFSLI